MIHVFSKSAECQKFIKMQEFKTNIEEIESINLSQY